MPAMFRKLAVLLMVFWAFCALLVWIWPATDKPLVGARRQSAMAIPETVADPAAIAEALLTLEKTPLWGVQRDGQALPPSKLAGQAEEPKVAWSVIATVVQKDHRIVLLQIDKEAPKPIKEGEQLPDGSKLLKVLPNAWIVETTEGGKTIVTSHFIASENEPHQKKISPLK